MESEDGDFDYSPLSLEGIEYAIEHIDPATHPKNLANARAALAARQAGRSPEPTTMDPKTDAAVTLWIERIIGCLMVLYSAIAVKNDDLVLLGGGKFHYRLFHLHGQPAWCAAAGLALVGGTLIVGGFDQSDPPKIRPKFRLVLFVALVTVLVGIGLSGWT